MKFVVDAQLPFRLCAFLVDSDCDAVHTTQLEHGNRTTDGEIAELADREQRIVVTKDRDFRNSHLLSGTPQRLLIVATGNVSNNELLDLFRLHLAQIIDAFESGDLVELRSDCLIVHGDKH